MPVSQWCSQCSKMLSVKLKASFRGTKYTEERPMKSSWIAKRNLRFGGAEEADFDSLDDHFYPVSENDAMRLSLNTRTETCMAGPGGREDLEMEDLKMNDLEHHQREPHSSIAVTKAWTVSSKAHKLNQYFLISAFRRLDVSSPLIITADWKLRHLDFRKDNSSRIPAGV